MISVVEPVLLIDIKMYLILPDNQQIANEGWFCRNKYQYKRCGILWLPQNIMTENKKSSQIWYLWEILIEDTSIWQNDENENILPQYVYITIKQTIQILITHCRYIDCTTLRRNTLYPFCQSIH